MNLSVFTSNEVKHLFKVAKRALRSPNFDILCAPARTPECGRILVITPRRVGNAVTRNKIRRRLKAIYYEQSLYLHATDCIVIVKEPGTQLNFEQLKELLSTAVNKYLQQL